MPTARQIHILTFRVNVPPRNSIPALYDMASCVHQFPIETPSPSPTSMLPTPPPSQPSPPVSAQRNDAMSLVTIMNPAAQEPITDTSTPDKVTATSAHSLAAVPYTGGNAAEAPSPVDVFTASLERDSAAGDEHKHGRYEMKGHVWRPRFEGDQWPER